MCANHFYYNRKGCPLFSKILLFCELGDEFKLFFTFLENKMLFWISNQMLLWEKVSMNLAVLINILVALFYPFSETVRGTVY